jgi:hypothetical protein
MADQRRFPTPWRSDRVRGGYVVRDATGQGLAYLYGRETEADARQAKVLTSDEAQPIDNSVPRLSAPYRSGPGANRHLGRAVPGQSKARRSRRAIAGKNERGDGALFIAGLDVNQPATAFF